MSLPPLPRLMLEPAIRAALLEDLGRAGDITADAIVEGPAGDLGGDVGDAGEAGGRPVDVVDGEVGAVHASDGTVRGWPIRSSSSTDRT